MRLPISPRLLGAGMARATHGPMLSRAQLPKRTSTSLRLAWHMGLLAEALLRPFPFQVLAR